MKNILFIDATIRKDSRTLELARHYLKSREIIDYHHLKLSSLDLKPLDEEELQQRNALIEENNFAHPSFALARVFKQADTVIIAAPLYDLSFPALLKIYLERINVVGLTFLYGSHGEPISMSNVKRVIYITTSGGPIEGYHHGKGYIEDFFRTFYQVNDFEYYCAQGLDVDPSKVEEIMEIAKQEMASKQ